MVGRLASAGMPVSDPVDPGRLRSLHAYEPNGIPLAFSWPLPDHNVVAHPRFMDFSPTLVPRASPDPWLDPEPVPEVERLLIPGEGKDHFDPA